MGQAPHRGLAIRLIMAVIGIAALALAYATASWAIASGRLTAYALTLILIIVALRELGKALFVRKPVVADRGKR